MAYYGEPFPGALKFPGELEANNIKIDYTPSYMLANLPQSEPVADENVKEQNIDLHFTLDDMNTMWTCDSSSDYVITIANDYKGKIVLDGEEITPTPVRPAVGDFYTHAPTNEKYIWDGACWVNVALMKQCDIPCEKETNPDKAYEYAMRVIG